MSRQKDAPIVGTTWITQNLKIRCLITVDTVINVDTQSIKSVLAYRVSSESSVNQNLAVNIWVIIMGDTFRHPVSVYRSNIYDSVASDGNVMIRTIWLVDKKLWYSSLNQNQSYECVWLFLQLPTWQTSYK